MRCVGGGANGSARGCEERDIQQGGWGWLARSGGAVDGRASSEDFAEAGGSDYAGEY